MIQKPLHSKKMLLNLLKQMRFIFPIIVVFLFTTQVSSKTHQKLQDTIALEIDRAVDLLGKESPSLYYLGCGITDIETVYVKSSFGALIKNKHSRSRVLDVDARCGDYNRDNTHPLPGGKGFNWNYPVKIPIKNDPVPIRMALWREIEKAYRNSSKQYAQVKAFDITKSALRDKSNDFSRSNPDVAFKSHQPLNLDSNMWAEKVKAYTLPIRKYPEIYQCDATFKAISLTRTFSNNEGTRIQSNKVGYYLVLNLTTRAEDGLDLPVFKTYFAWDQNELPDDETIGKKMIELAELAMKLKIAPLAEPYAGPALLSGSASAVFMHEVLGHRLEGHRQKDDNHSQTFRNMVGSQVMPEFLSVIFDPGLKYYKKNPLAGYYQFDEQGVPGQKVVSIDHGILKQFLMSRTPIEGFSVSNGHARAEAGEIAVSRQSNLIVKTTAPISTEELRKRLIKTCITLNKPYGLLFSQIQGGFTMTSRTAPNAFNVLPLVVYRVYTDGRPDELVRGVDIVGTPLSALTKIIASGNDTAIFNGYCGAESGSIAVGAASPSLLLNELEVQRKRLSQAKLPVLDPPPPPLSNRTDQLRNSNPEIKTRQILEVMEAEVQRCVNDLKLPDSPGPYFASCTLIQGKQVYAGAELGSAIYSKDKQYANLCVSLRVGDYKLDNTNFLSQSSSGSRSILDVNMPVPIDMDPFAIKRAIWWSMDQAYKKAIENLNRKKSILETLSSPPAQNDFSKVPVFTYFSKTGPARLPSVEEITKQAEQISMVMSDSPGLRRSYTGISLDACEVWYVNSEGSKNHDVTNTAAVSSLALAQSEDGTLVGDNIRFIAERMETIKPIDEIKNEVKALCSRVEALRTAPLLNEYIGPVLFEDQASAELCSRVLTPAFISSKKPVTEGIQWNRGGTSLHSRLGRRIMSTNFNIFDDPTKKYIKGGDFLGSKQVDLEGVKPEKVQLVKNGTLKTLLTTRTPDKKLPKSNGHAFSFGYGYSDEPRYIPSAKNLFIEYKHGVSRKRLKKKLLKAIKNQGVDCGLIIRRISPEGMLLIEGSSYYNYDNGEAGNVNDPMFAFRVLPDGREELVRLGVLSGIQLSSFKDVLAAGKNQYVLSGQGKKRSMAVIAPSILFEEGVIQNREGDVYKASIIKSPILSFN